MPNAVVKSYAEKTGKSVEHVERWWDEAKEEALKKFGKKNKRFWAYVNGIVKRRAGLSEQLTFKDYMLLEELMNEDLGENAKKITTKIYNKAYNLVNPDYIKVPRDKAGNQVVYVFKKAVYAGKSYMKHIFYYLVNDLKLEMKEPYDSYDDMVMFSSHEIFKVKGDYLLEVDIDAQNKKIELSVYKQDENHGDSEIDKLAARGSKILSKKTGAPRKNKREETSFSMDDKSIQEMAVEINQFLNQAIKDLNRK